MSDKKIKVKINNQYQYIQLLNGLFNLTETEMRILSLFAQHQQHIQDNNLSINPFSPEIKKQVAQSLERDDFNTLNNYIKRLKDKKAIKESGGGYLVTHILMLNDTKQITFIING